MRGHRTDRPDPRPGTRSRWARGGLAAALLGGALVLAVPQYGRAFVLSGDLLDLGQRDYRVNAGFTDPTAWRNATPDPDFPGSVGAELAIRKGIAEWGSRPHGTGTTDPTQPELGSGGANFDPFYAGRTHLVGGANGNIVSVISGVSGILAFTELPTSDGWRIRFFEDPRDWNDGPHDRLDGADPMDIQGIACHEYGHALGLGHSFDPEATMFAGVPPDGGISHRSLAPDDVAGVQAIYGVASPGKPVVTGYQVFGGQVRLEGTGFDPVANEVWFSHAGAAKGWPVRVAGVPSAAGGLRLTVPIPPGVGPGDVAVRLPGLNPEDLSNAFPFDPSADWGWTPPSAYGTGKATSAGSVPVLRALTLPSTSTGQFLVEVDGGLPGEWVVVFSGDATQSTPWLGGQLLVAGRLRREATAQLDGTGRLRVSVPVLASWFGTTRHYQAWLRDPADPQGAALTQGLTVPYLP